MKYDEQHYIQSVDTVETNSSASAVILLGVFIIVAFCLGNMLF
jgi:hypothetical protein